MLITSGEIKDNYARVKEQAGNAAIRSGRKPEDVKLIVVSKGQPVEVVLAAVEAGITVFGENYPEEAVSKIADLDETPKLEWHMIGHLQSRKAKLVCAYFDWMHSLDSLRLAEKLARILREGDQRLPVLLEFNVGGEASKYGWWAADPKRWDDLLPELEAVFAFDELDVRGLMTMPPLTTSPHEAEVYFQQLGQLRDFLRRRFSRNSMPELSMGTSVDFVNAIHAGATMVRIGQAILGARR
ncbi:MAG: YggS family pyridoxal phosphate-dependent enzyme [Bellilinea sp.]|jgi:pyridoxal phosphate enzyme (YggS family)